MTCVEDCGSEVLSLEQSISLSRSDTISDVCDMYSTNEPSTSSNRIEEPPGFAHYHSCTPERINRPKRA